MSDKSFHSHQRHFACFNLKLGGHRLLIQAGDTASDEVVSALANVMLVPPVSPRTPVKFAQKTDFRHLLVFIDPSISKPVIDVSSSKPELCILPPCNDKLMFIFALSQVALSMAQGELSRGGLLVHGALAEAPANLGGGGVIFCGSSTVGKTTASNRLPLPWRSLSDDTTLILPDSKGQYRAHPWPTWSRFYDTDDGDTKLDNKWDVQRGVPLRAIFFLTQAAEDRTAPLPSASSITCLLETARHVSRLITKNLPPEQTHEVHRKEWLNTKDVVRAIPAYTLHLSLTGTFWKNIEEILTVNVQDSKQNRNRCSNTEKKNTILQDYPFADNALVVNCSGFSMKPTLYHPDILEVTPYRRQQVQRGDIIFFKSPMSKSKIVHRVVSITSDGLNTRGDNNQTTDTHIVKAEDVIGRVTAAWRHGKRRSVAGGWKGEYIGYFCILRRKINKIFVPLLRGIYQKLSSNRFIANMLPAILRPRIIEFRQQHLPSILKLMIKNHVIGSYHFQHERWQINHPWRLIINSANLPITSKTSVPSSTIQDSTL